jgi:hypothetical protein
VYHRLRNELYHQGNGLTVERDKVEVYAEIANVLFKNLFGFALIEEPSKTTELLGEFLHSWITIERGVSALIDRELVRQGTSNTRHITLRDRLAAAERTKLFSVDDLEQIEGLRRIRNRALHAEKGWEDDLTPVVLKLAAAFAKRVAPYAANLQDPVSSRSN